MPRERPARVLPLLQADPHGRHLLQPHAQSARSIRHINPWNPPKDFLTYPEYEDMYREAMVGAGLPVDKPLENKNTAKSGE